MVYNNQERIIHYCTYFSMRTYRDYHEESVIPCIIFRMVQINYRKDDFSTMLNFRNYRI